MEKDDDIIIIEEEDQEYALPDVTEEASDYVIVQLRDYCGNYDDEEETNRELPTKLEEAMANFEHLLDRVLKKQTSAAVYIPQVIYHLSKLAQVLARHKRALTDLGFDVYEFNSTVTSLFTRYKKRLANGVTTMALFVSFLDITENKWSKEGDQPDKLAKAQRNEFFALLKEKINNDIIEFDDIKTTAMATKEEYSKKNIEKKLKELEKSVEKIPKLAKILKTAISCICSGVLLGGGSAAAAASAGTLTLMGVTLPPVLAGVVVGGVLAVVSASIGAIVAFKEQEKLQKRLQDRIDLLRSIYNIGNNLLEAIMSGCDDILMEIRRNDSLLLESWTKELIPTESSDRMRKALKMNLERLIQSYSDTFDKLKAYDGKILASHQFLHGDAHDLAIDLRMPNPRIYSNAINMTPLEWQKDSEAPICNGCQRPFTFWRRRHHCRLCRKIFCATCTSNKAEIGPNGLQGRACATCAPQQQLPSPRAILLQIQQNETFTVEEDEYTLVPL